MTHAGIEDRQRAFRCGNHVLDRCLLSIPVYIGLAQADYLRVLNQRSS